MTLKHIFGDTPTTRILDFLIDHKGDDYSKTEIANHIDIGWNTISRHWTHLQDWDLVVPTRQIGRATMYKLNTENPIVAQMLVFNESISDHMSEHINEGE